MGLEGELFSKKRNFDAAPTAPGRGRRKGWIKSQMAVPGQGGSSLAAGPRRGRHRAFRCWGRRTRDGAWSIVGARLVLSGNGLLRNRPRCRKVLLPRLQKVATRRRGSFSGDNAPQRERNIRWLEPALVRRERKSAFAGGQDQGDDVGSGIFRVSGANGQRDAKEVVERFAEHQGSKPISSSPPPPFFPFLLAAR